MAEWAKFGRCHIQDGDILFRYGLSYKPYEIATSRIIAGAEDNRFSHDGIARWENDVLYVYDAEPPPQGIRKVPFEFWVLDVANKSLTIKRPRPEFQRYVPAALAYCEDVYQRQVPFDDALSLTDDKLYCSEMIEKAYRCAGLVLSEPVRITCLPNYNRWRILKPVVQGTTPIRVANMIFALGNPYYGTFRLAPYSKRFTNKVRTAERGPAEAAALCGRTRRGLDKTRFLMQSYMPARPRLTRMLREGRPQSFASDREFAWRVGMSDLETVDLVKQGIELARAGNKTQARPLLRQAVEQDPENETAWMWLASVAETPHDALTYLERVLAIYPENARARAAAHAARLKAGVAAAKAHKNTSARILLNVVVGDEPENELAWLWLANAAETPAEAARCLEKVLAINPDNTLARSTYERCRSVARIASQTPVPAPALIQTASDDLEVRSGVQITVLLVDDDPDVREALASVLVDAGYQILAAADGFEAIAVLRDHGRLDLILLAAALPGGMDGYQLCKLLRENTATSQTPLVLLSETSSFVSKMRGRMVGAVAELVKPFVASELLRVVREFCPAPGRD